MLWVLDFLRDTQPYDDETKTARVAVMKNQLYNLGYQMGERRRPIPDLQTLIDDGRAMHAGGWIFGKREKSMHEPGQLPSNLVPYCQVQKPYASQSSSSHSLHVFCS